VFLEGFWFVGFCSVLAYVSAPISDMYGLEPPEEGKSIEFPRKHAILADCTTID